jgi:sugar/nucleoside kinase (ribokinase family)
MGVSPQDRIQHNAQGRPVTTLAARVVPRDTAGMTTGPDILCIGSFLWDIIGRTPARIPSGGDVPGRILRQPGGVAMNIAVALARMGLRPAVLSAVGRDAEGDELVAVARALGLDCRFVWRSPDLPTDRYMAIEDKSGLVAAIADAHSLEAAGELVLAPFGDGRLGSEASPWPGPVVIDGNLTEALLAGIAASPLLAAADLRIAPASPGKAARLKPFVGLANVTLYVNRIEADILTGRANPGSAAGAQALLDLGARRVLVTDGAGPVADGSHDGILTALPPAVTQRRVTGAGDTFLAAHIVAERRGAARAAALGAALAAAADHVGGSA